MSQCGQDVNVELQDVISNPLPQFPAIPPTTGVGQVIDIDDWPTTGLITVTPGIQVPTLSSYRPFPGDLAYLIKQGGQWIAIGSLSTRGIGGSLPSDGISADGTMARWSFEAGPLIQDSGWTIVSNTPPGEADITSVAVGDAPHGLRVAEIFIGDASNGQNIDVVMRSPSIPVAPGQRWAMSGWFISTNGGFTASYNNYISGSLREEDGFPIDGGGIGVQFGGASTGWIQSESRTGYATIPAGVTSMRAQISYTLTAAANNVLVYCQFDDIQVRRVS